MAGGEDVAFFYNGWNCIAEYQVGTSTPKARYIWGLDLSGSMQGAGGVGGLLVVTNSAGSYYPTYDGNGNVSEYVNSSGASVAHFEYDAFGNVVNFTESSAGVAASFRHRFSTKPQDNETGLLYYGYRYFDPVTGRWPSRDPIGERGGKNLYGFVFNSPLGFIDLLGSAPLQIDVNSEIWRKIPREIQIRILNDKLGRVIVPGPNTGNIVDDIASVLAWIQSYEESGEDVPDYVTDRLDDLVDLSQLPPFQNSCKCCNPETGEVVETMEFWEKEGMESFDSCVDKNLKHGWVRQMRTAMSAASRASVVVVVGGASITKVIKTIKTCNKIRRIVQIASVVGTVATIAEWAGEKAYNDDVEQASEKCGKCVCPDGFLLECGRTTNYNY